MNQIKPVSGAIPVAVMAEAAAACMRTTAELQSRLAAGWLELLTQGMAPPAVAAWGMEAMRLTAETTLRNIQHCQDCANRSVGTPR